MSIPDWVVPFAQTLFGVGSIINNQSHRGAANDQMEAFNQANYQAYLQHLEYTNAVRQAEAAASGVPSNRAEIMQGIAARKAYLEAAKRYLEPYLLTHCRFQV